MRPHTIKKKLLIFSLSTVALFFFCEFAIYYIVIIQCSWPRVDWKPESRGDSPLKAMFLADTHLLGPIRGHWFDKLRREWQMYRSFQTTIQLFHPEAVFFLGDIFDEGQLVTVRNFNEYVERFHSIFAIPPTTKRYVIVGNHDIGFHYWITPSLQNRFENAFNSSAVRRVRVKEINFILVNSMAMEGDGCFLCKPAVKKIIKISESLRCEKNESIPECDSKIKSYTRPILLQHFPLYRPSDASCSGDDAAPDSEKQVLFREKIDCLSSSSSHLLLRKLEPRLILSGHTHHGCLYQHKVTYEEGDPMSRVPEYSIASFSWRNRDNPSFFLGHFTSENYQLSKCYLPRESTVMLTYFYSGMAIFLGTVGYVPRRSRDLISNLKLIGILTLSIAAYWYVHGH